MKKNIIIILLIIISIVALIIYINKSKVTKNTNNNSSEVKENISYTCQKESKSVDNGIYQETNLLFAENNSITKYEVGYNFTYSNADLYNNTLLYLNSQNTQQYKDLGNNTIFSYKEININDFLNSIGINENNSDKIISLLIEEGYNCKTT